MTRKRQSSLGYVPGLDGIRGAAILLVLAYHFLGLPAGFYGVDVFFVLSGFLITTLLLEERAATGRISFRAFYMRRARRLLPALLAMLFLSFILAAGFLAGHKDHLAAWLFEGVAVCLFYSANVWRMLGHTLPTQLTPMWSLAEEEQFYLLWPALFLLLSSRMRARRLAFVLAGVAIATTAWRAGLTLASGPTGRIYFGPDMRSTGLLAGAAAAAARASGLQFPRVRIPMAAPLAVIGLLAWFAHGDTLFAYAVGFPIAELAALALIGGALSGSPILAVRPLVWVGTVSYGIYVWMATVAVFDPHGIAPAVAAIGVGWASTRLIEQRFRRSRARIATPEPAVAAAALR